MAIYQLNFKYSLFCTLVQNKPYVNILLYCYSGYAQSVAVVLFVFVYFCLWPTAKKNNRRLWHLRCHKQKP
jgi:hypothetical protein